MKTPKQPPVVYRVISKRRVIFSSRNFDIADCLLRRVRKTDPDAYGVEDIANAGE
jgi:hypothetical protein